MQKYILLGIQDRIPFYYDLATHCGYHRICCSINFGRSFISFALFAIPIACIDSIASEYHTLFGLLFIFLPFVAVKFIAGKEEDEYLPCAADLLVLQQRLPYILRHFMLQCLCLVISLLVFILCAPTYMASGSMISLLGVSGSIFMIYQVIIDQLFFKKVKIIRLIKRGIQP